ncbi:MAG TPA: ABC transporter ATP-binding protein [Actinomycetota bacterium]|nr:ABC transporter ATP-binding protein [Actinomycetota bacterium]
MTLVLVAAVLMGAALPVAFQLASGALVGTVPGAVAGGPGSPAADRLQLALVAVAVVFVAQQVLAPVRTGFAEAFGRRVDGALRARTMRAVLAPSGIAHLEDPEVLDRISAARGVGTGNWKPGDAIVGLAGAWSNLLAGVASAVVLATFHPLAAASLLAVWVVVIRRFRREFMEVVEVHVGETPVLRRAQYLRDIALAPAAVKETRIFGLSRWVSATFDEHAVSALREVWRRRSKGWGAIAWAVALIGAANFATILLVGLAGARGTISLGELTVYIQAVFGVGALANIGDNELRVAYGAGSVPPLLELERSPSPAALTGLLPADGAPREAIRFEGVRFRYPGRDTDVFDGLDLTIPAGRSLAVVGSNGAGKTTLVKLLSRLYDPQEGRVAVDGVDLREIDPDAWQRRIGAIFQDFVRYELSARCNVGYGALDRIDDDAALTEAARRSGAWPAIESLADGWDTPLARHYEGGAELSGGQWQRVALARALFAVKSGAGVLILDEPTANLDVRSEADIYDRFLELTQGLTTIVISHRFSTVRRADRIVVLEGGRVVEEGSHEELMQRGGRYAHMFRLQAARFTDTEEAV